MSVSSKRRASKQRAPARRMVRAVPIALAVVVVAIIIAIAVANRSSVPLAIEPDLSFNVLSPGDSAPDFTAVTTQGPFSLKMAERPVLLEVFATWCPHCQHETAIMNQLYAKYRHDIDFVAVSGSPYGMDRSSPESLTDVLEFMQIFRVRCPVAFDRSLTVSKSYLQGGFPTIVLIGTNKHIRYIDSGEIAEAKLDRVLRGTLAKR